MFSHREHPLDFICTLAAKSGMHTRISGIAHEELKFSTIYRLFDASLNFLYKSLSKGCISLHYASLHAELPIELEQTSKAGCSICFNFYMFSIAAQVICYIALMLQLQTALSLTLCQAPLAACHASFT